MKQALSTEQANIVLHNEGEEAILVEASAGSGKTRVLTERVRYLLTEKKDKYFSVLCLTFTNKAADEMKERLEKIPKLSERVFIGNFHDFCLQKILRPRRHLIGLQEMPHIFEKRDDLKKILLDTLYSNELLKEIYQFSEITDTKEKEKKQTALVDKCLNFISESKRNLEIVPEYTTEWKNWGEKNTFLYKEYCTKLINQNAMDYDDILLYAYRILNENPQIAELCRKDYQYILIDEAQDLNYAQYEIIKTICGTSHKNVLMVGDPKQAIYSFNGADTIYMQKHFIEDFGAEKFEIKHNYRSAQKILELAQNIQKNGGIGTNFFEGIAELFAFEDENEEAEWIINKIKYWQEKGIYVEEGKEEVKEDISLKNIAVLARNKYVFSKLINYLETDEILKDKFYLRKGVEQFEPDSIFMKVFDLGLRVLTNPADTLHYKQIFSELQIPYLLTEERIETLLHLKKTDILTENALQTIVESWKKLKENPKSLGKILDDLEPKIDSFEIHEEELQKIVFDISQLQKYWNVFIRQEPYEKQDINNFRYFLALNSTQENKEELILSTIHASKGLEFEIVFLMGMNQGTFPDFRAMEKGKKVLQEEKNNAYVAVTRAKRCIYLTYPKNKTMPWGKIKKQERSIFLENFLEKNEI
ncbi:MAG: ATP-dependent helicase [Bacteroidetes bacterium]|nr:MAG: ATP-dependent helicase [Bacteroidota bacterium]TAG91896.1 MAG: ATP-dependent helicase [Bacteroidota bacterium]